MRVLDRGSRPSRETVTIQDVPAQGLIDTGADISIMGGDQFKKVASVAQLRKRDFKWTDKVPVTYNNQQLQLDGQMDLDIAFGETTIRTPVYLKMDARNSSSSQRVSAASLDWSPIILEWLLPTYRTQLQRIGARPS